MAFKVGDVVVLRSGGPEMTVSDPNAYGGQVDCQWFGGRKLEHGRFPPQSLALAAKDEKPKK